MLRNQRISFICDVMLELGLKFVDFVSKICDDVFVSADVLTNKLFVGFYSHLNVLCSVSIL